MVVSITLSEFAHEMAKTKNLIVEAKEGDLRHTQGFNGLQLCNFVHGETFEKSDSARAI